MTEDTNATISDTTNQDPASAATPGVDQTGAAGAGTGTASDTSSGNDNASSTNDTSSKMDLDTFGDKVGRNQSTQVPATATHSNVTGAQAPAAIDWAKAQEELGIKSPDDIRRLVGQQSLFGRQANELGELRRQHAQIQQQMQQDRQRQEQEAQRANLSPFHAKNPQFQLNQSRIAKANAFNSALSSLPPELQQDPAQRNRLAQSMGVANEDLKMAQDAKAYQDQILMEQASDPEGFVEKRIERVMQQSFSRFEEYLNNKNQAQQFVQQHQAFINNPETQQIMSQVLDERTPRSELAVRIARLESEKAQLLSRAKSETAEVSHLKAQDELATRQTVTRRRASTATTTQSDPWASYKDKPFEPKATDQLLDRMFKARQ